MLNSASIRAINLNAIDRGKAVPTNVVLGFLLLIANRYLPTGKQQNRQYFYSQPKYLINILNSKDIDSTYF